MGAGGGRGQLAAVRRHQTQVAQAGGDVGCRRHLQQEGVADHANTSSMAGISPGASASTITPMKAPRRREK